jgi:multidrug resistance efflux pump
MNVCEPVGVLAEPDSPAQSQESVSPDEKETTRWRHLLRGIAGAILIGAAILWAIWFGFSATSEGSLASDKSTQTAPISGTLERLNADVGDNVDRDQVLAVIRNERVDTGRLEGLRVQRSAKLTKLESLQKEVSSRVRERDRLQTAYEQLLAFKAADLERHLRETEAQLAAITTAQSRQRDEYRMTNDLFEQKIVSRREMERARDAWIAANQAVEAQAATVARAVNSRAALTAGSYIDPDFTVQKARLEDLTILLGDLKLQMEEIASQIKVDDSTIQIEEGHVERLRQAVVKSPVHGRVWRRAANEGQYVTAGADLVELTDDSSIRAEAYIHQRFLADVAIGDEVRVLPIASHNELRGTVRWIGSEDTGQTATNAPQRWIPNQAKAMRVIISLNPADQHNVWVGQRVRIVILKPWTAWLAKLDLTLSRIIGR